MTSKPGPFLLAVAAVVYLQLTAVPAAPPTEPAAPALPRALVDTTPIPITGTTHRARNAEELRRILGLAQSGDAIVLEAGAVFSGPFTLPEKPGSGWITIRTSAEDKLPTPGTRVDPSHAPLMPKLESATESVITAAPGAHHYRLIGLEIRPKAGGFLFNLVAFGTFEKSLEALPHHFVVDRCYLHGDPRLGTRRGIALNGREIAVIDSYLSDFKEVGADSQAIAGWNGPRSIQDRQQHPRGRGGEPPFWEGQTRRFEISSPPTSRSGATFSANPCRGSREIPPSTGWPGPSRTCSS